LLARCDLLLQMYRGLAVCLHLHIPLLLARCGLSVTPILSRIAEKYVVSKWLRPFTPASSVIDQYGFKPTGSTTAALTCMMHNVTIMLESNNYVRCLMTDFSTAFDTVDHIVLVKNFSCWAFLLIFLIGLFLF